MATSNNSINFAPFQRAKRHNILSIQIKYHVDARVSKETKFEGAGVAISISKSAVEL